MQKFMGIFITVIGLILVLLGAAYLVTIFGPNVNVEYLLLFVFLLGVIIVAVIIFSSK
jgi:uncharacterized membrane protein